MSDITSLQNMASLNVIQWYKNPLTAQSLAFLETFRKQPEKIVYDDLGSSAYAVTKVFIDGKVHLFHTHPLVYTDSTMLPLRELFKLFGVDVQWDGVTRKVTATLGDNQIELTINLKKALLNHQEVDLLAEPIILNDHRVVTKPIFRQKINNYINKKNRVGLMLRDFFLFKAESFIILSFGFSRLIIVMLFLYCRLIGRLLARLETRKLLIIYY